MDKKASYIVGFVTSKMKYCDVFILKNATRKQADHVQNILDTKYSPLAFYCNLKPSAEPQNISKIEKRLDRELK